MALVQLIIAHRGGVWVLLRGGHEVGDYPTLEAAREVAGAVARQIKAEDDDCELLIYDEAWSAEACSD